MEHTNTVNCPVCERTSSYHDYDAMICKMNQKYGKSNPKTELKNCGLCNNKNNLYIYKDHFITLQLPICKYCFTKLENNIIINSKF
jgi:hypothetical protein